MTRNIVLAAFAAALISLPSASLAQEAEAPPPSPERARELLSVGRPAEALAILEKLPSDVDTTRLRIDVLLALGDFPASVKAYGQLVSLQKRPAPDALSAIAVRRAQSYRKHSDAQIRVAACEALILAGQPADCAAELEAIAADRTSGFENRLAAARILAEQKTRGGAALLQLVISQGIQESPAITADALSRLPRELSNEPLKRLLLSDNADAQYLAALALARRRLPDAVPALRAVGADPEAGAARLMAYIALAALGEADGVKVLRETLPLLKGRDRLEAARALKTLEDPAAGAMIEELLNSEHEMVRIETAELLHADRSSRAASALAAAIESANPWVRATGIAAAARAGIAPGPSVTRALADSNPHVALAAARAVLLDLRARR